MATKTYISGPVAHVRVNVGAASYSKGDFYKAGRLSGFVVTEPDSSGDMIIAVEGVFIVPFLGTNAVVAGDVVEYNSGSAAFEKPATPTAADAIVLEDHAAANGTLKVLLVPGLKL